MKPEGSGPKVVLSYGYCTVCIIRRIKMSVFQNVIQKLNLLIIFKSLIGVKRTEKNDSESDGRMRTILHAYGVIIEVLRDK